VRRQAAQLVDPPALLGGVSNPVVHNLQSHYDQVANTVASHPGVQLVDV